MSSNYELYPNSPAIISLNPIIPIYNNPVLTDSAIDSDPTIGIQSLFAAGIINPLLLPSNSTESVGQQIDVKFSMIGSDSAIELGSYIGKINTGSYKPIDWLNNTNTNIYPYWPIYNNNNNNNNNEFFNLPINEDRYLHYYLSWNLPKQRDPDSLFIPNSFIAITLCQYDPLNINYNNCSSGMHTINSINDQNGLSIYPLNKYISSLVDEKFYYRKIKIPFTGVNIYSGLIAMCVQPYTGDYIASIKNAVITDSNNIITQVLAAPFIFKINSGSLKFVNYSKSVLPYNISNCNNNDNNNNNNNNGCNYLIYDRFAIISFTGIFNPIDSNLISMIYTDGIDNEIPCNIIYLNNTYISCQLTGICISNLYFSIYLLNRNIPYLNLNSTDKIYCAAPVIIDGTLRHFNDSYNINGNISSIVATNNGFPELIQFNANNFGGPIAALNGLLKIWIGPDNNPIKFTCIPQPQYITDNVITCLTQSGIGVGLRLTIGIGNTVKIRGNDLYSFPAIPVILAISSTDCINNGNSVINCPTIGNVPLTIIGSNLFIPIQIYIGNKNCDNPIQYTGNGQSIGTGIICNLPSGTGQLIGVLPISTNLIGIGVNLLSYALPIISNVYGCSDNNGLNCDRGGGSILTIVGNYFGYNGVRIFIAGQLCINSIHDINSPQIIIYCTMRSGFGFNLILSIQQFGGEIVLFTNYYVSYTPCLKGSHEDIFNSNNNYCSICEIGKYSSSNGNLVCNDCELGYYNPLINSTYCLQAPPGSIVDQRGASNYTNCGPGLFADGSTKCSYCKIGTYSNESTNIECIPCPMGFYGNSIGLTTSNCSGLCSSGYYCPERSIISNSIPCNPGYYSNAGAGYCNECLLGKYSSIKGSSICDLCHAGYYTNGNASSNCFICPSSAFYCPLQLNNIVVSIGPLLIPSGYYSSGFVNSDFDGTGSTIYLPCNQGYYCRNGVEIACDIGSYQNSTSQTNCKICEAGKYSYLTNSTICMDCYPGYYQSLAGQQYCLPCPVGQYSNITGSIYCIPCKSGYYSGGINAINANTKCDPCIPGTYSAIIGGIVCTACNQNHYTSAYASTKCEECISPLIVTNNSSSCIEQTFIRISQLSINNPIPFQSISGVLIFIFLIFILLGILSVIRNNNSNINSPSSICNSIKIYFQSRALDTFEILGLIIMFIGLYSIYTNYSSNNNNNPNEIQLNQSCYEFLWIYLFGYILHHASLIGYTRGLMNLLNENFTNEFNSIQVAFKSSFRLLYILLSLQLIFLLLWQILSPYNSTVYTIQDNEKLISVYRICSSNNIIFPIIQFIFIGLFSIYSIYYGVSQLMNLRNKLRNSSISSKNQSIAIITFRTQFSALMPVIVLLFSEILNNVLLLIVLIIINQSKNQFIKLFPSIIPIVTIIYSGLFAILYILFHYTEFYSAIQSVYKSKEPIEKSSINSSVSIDRSSSRYRSRRKIDLTINPVVSASDEISKSIKPVADEIELSPKRIIYNTN